jgi:hypothetical protein
MRRPDSLAEVASWTGHRAEFHYHLADFLDAFRRAPGVSMPEQEPEPLRGRFDGGDVCDAYLAAVAVSLGRGIGVAPPGWAGGPDRRLRTPWFASPGPAIRATLLLESPAPFRERNLFVSANALSRA